MSHDAASIAKVKSIWALSEHQVTSMAKAKQVPALQ